MQQREFPHDAKLDIISNPIAEDTQSFFRYCCAAHRTSTVGVRAAVQVTHAMRPAPSMALLRALSRALGPASPPSTRHASTQTLPRRIQPGHAPCNQNAPLRASRLGPRRYAGTQVPAQSSESNSTPAQSGLHDPDSPHYRGPASDETTQTHFPAMDVLANAPPPSNSIDACLTDGFVLDNGVKIRGPRRDGLMLVNGEAFRWRLAGVRGSRCFDQPGRGDLLLNKRGQWDGGIDTTTTTAAQQQQQALWGLLELLWPKPELLILGLGPSIHPLAPSTKAYLNALGVRVDVQDTRNAAAHFNLLATERGVDTIAAALVPLGWPSRQAK